MDETVEGPGEPTDPRATPPILRRQPLPLRRQTSPSSTSATLAASDTTKPARVVTSNDEDALLTSQQLVRRDLGAILKSPPAIVIAVVFAVLAVIFSIGDTKENVRDYIKKDGPNNDLSDRVSRVAPWRVAEVYYEKSQCPKDDFECRVPCPTSLSGETDTWKCLINYLKRYARYATAFYDTSLYMLNQGVAGILVFTLPFVVSVFGLLVWSAVAGQPFILYPPAWLVIFVGIGVMGVLMRLVVLGVLGVVEYTLAAFIVTEGVYTIWEKLQLAAKMVRWYNGFLERAEFASN